VQGVPRQEPRNKSVLELASRSSIIRRKTGQALQGIFEESRFLHDIANANLQIESSAAISHDTLEPGRPVTRPNVSWCPSRA